MYYIIVYKSTHDAMEADKILTERKVEFRVMPTPTTVTQSCGICTRINDKEYIDDIIENQYFEFKNIYKKSDDGFNIIK